MELDETIKSEVERITNEARESDTMTVEDRISMFKEAWNLLPSPKEQYVESFYIMDWLTDVYFYLKNYEEAWKYAQIFLHCYPARFHGEQEYTYAKTAYEVGNLEEAMKYFAITDEKSEGRIWKRDDAMKYFKFYKGKN